MDRFLQQWKSNSNNNSNNNPHIASDEDDMEEEESMPLSEFIVPDDEEEEDEGEELVFEDHHLKSGVSGSHFRDTSVVTSQSSRKKKKRQRKEVGEQKDHTTVKAQASTSSSTPTPPSATTQPSSASAAASVNRRLAMKLHGQSTHKRHKRQQRLKEQEADEEKEIQIISHKLSTHSPTLATSQAKRQVVPIVRVTNNTTLSTSSSTSRAITSPSTASSTTTLLLSRKRKHVLIFDEDDNEQLDLVNLIDDFDGELTDNTKTARNLSTGAVELNNTKARVEIPPHSYRNIIGMMEAMRCNVLPFPGLQLARLERLKQEQLESPPTATPEPMAAPQPSTFCHQLPFYASSPFRSMQLFHHGFMHQALHAQWQHLQPVRDWSLFGQFGSVDVESEMMRPLHSQLNTFSYVNQMEFDHGGVLLSSTSTNARFNLYDFESIWSDGRKIERENRSRLLRWQEDQARIEHLSHKRTNSPLRAGKWTLNQPLPAIRSSARPEKPMHQYLTPVFSMNLHPDARPTIIGATSSSNANTGLKQIDSHHWNPYHSNEIAMTSTRNNQVFMSVQDRNQFRSNLDLALILVCSFFLHFPASASFSRFDLTRCDEYGSPHRRVLACDSIHSNQYGSGIMDFRWFPSKSSQTLITALRSGAMNVIDLRIPTGASSTDWTGASTPIKLFPPQNASLSPRGSSQSNPPISLQLSACGNKMFVFTELGNMECWDTRFTRAAYERVLLLDSLFTNTNGPPTSLQPQSNSLGLEHRSPSSRLCSSSIHPQDDLCFLFQLLNGSIGFLDLNPSSTSYRQCRTVVPYDPDFISSDGEFSMRPRQSHCFIPNGSKGSNSNGRREKMVAVGNTQNHLQIWGQGENLLETPRWPIMLYALHSIVLLSVLFRPLIETSFSRPSPSLDPSPVSSGVSSWLDLLCSFPITTDPHSRTSFSSETLSPIMSIVVHPHQPFIFTGTKDQQIRIATHSSELETGEDPSSS